MFTLNLLGGAAFQGVDGPVSGRAAHKRRVALLAILASARGRTVGRERIIGLLWPEHRSDAARHLLSESLYVLRKELGEAAFVSSGDEVGLNGAVVRSDLEEFAGCVEAGEVERAARLYRGPFLDGFYVADAPEFERWAEAERDRLARAHTRALECLAAAREGEGLPAEAAEWWRRLVVLDPYNSRVGMRLMLALDAAGERAAALWFAETHVAFLREELGVEPDDEFQELVERLRSDPVRVPPAPPLPPPPVPVAAPAAGLAPAAPAAPAGDRPGTIDAAAEGSGTAEAQPGPAAASPAPPSAPSAPRLVAVRARRVVPPLWTAALGLLLGGAGAVLAARAGEPRDPARAGLPAPPAGYDPRRVAVLYFEDYSRGGELGYLANGLTESLIHALSQVAALEVISRNGVKPYRDRTVRFDSMAADLQAGSVVEGSVQRSGDSVRVTVQLVDANTKAHLESRTLVHPMTGIFALEDALADSVSRLLRRRLGEEIELRRTRAETRSEVAWKEVIEAEGARDDAARLLRSGEPLDADDAVGRLARADSLLERAERADPAWVRPTVLRGWVAHSRSLLSRTPARWDGLAWGFAERALRREPGGPRALELHGRLLFSRAVAAVDSAGQRGTLDRAEGELRAAVTAEPSLASAWSSLSQLLRYRGRFAESDVAARRALGEDAYLEDADDILHRLFFGALFTGRYAEADSLCARAHARFPADWRFVECRLTLMRSDTSRAADPAAARGVVAALARIDPAERARREGRAYSPIFRQLVAAAVVARAGETDSARAMVAQARVAAGGDADLRLSCAYDEAYVRLMLGERGAARALLDSTLAHRPALRPFALRDPLLRGLYEAPRPGATAAGSGTR